MRYFYPAPAERHPDERTVFGEGKADTEMANIEDVRDAERFGSREKIPDGPPEASVEMRRRSL
ncbi:MAG: hypothetical protein H0U65_10800 [Rubrobacter sp.]|nr:hypothetical protein [Rubrobacter sp.]